MRKTMAAFGIGALALGAARGEVIEITGEFAAPYREASLLRSISIDRISGEDGPALARAIEQGLEGGPFELLGGRTGSDIADGALTGGVTSGVEETRFEKQEKQCVQKGQDGKCLKEEQVKTLCRRRIVNVNVDLRLVRNRDGRILYSVSKPFRSEASWCAGEQPQETVEETISGAVRDIGASVRADLAPSVQTYRIRVRESDRGMSKAQASHFKALVKLSKRDAGAACAGWAALRSELPAHPSLLFDLGLCAEQAGRYEEAMAFYQDAARAGAGEGNEGVGRAQRLIDGREDARRRAQG